MAQGIPSRIIDFHVHLFPEKMMEAIRRSFISSYSWDIIYRFGSQESITYLRNHGVDKMVYSNYAHKAGIASGLNEWNFRILDEYPDLYCFAAYHPDDPDALEIASAALAHPRVLGIKLQLLVQCFYPQDERLFPIYEMVMDKGKYLLFHVGTGPVGNEFVGIRHFSKVLERYPGLPAIVAHMGAYEYQDFVDLLDDHANIYLDTAFAFIKEFEGKGSFNLGSGVLEKYSSRILYGSDFPNLIMPRESEIETLEGMGLSNAFYENVFYGNGEKLIKRIKGDL